MIIGIDAGALSVTDERLKVGVYKVTLRLLENIALIDDSNNYRLYSFKKIEQGVLERLGKRFENRVLSPPNGYFKIRLPIELKLHPVDVFLGLSQALPLSMSHNIGVVYDLGFLHAPQAYRGSLAKLISQTADLANRADHIIAISGSTRDDIIKHYDFPAADISVCYPGIDEIFRPTGPKYQSLNPYFLCVGSLKPGKNLASIISAFSGFLKTRKPDFDLVIAGPDYWHDPEIGIAIKRFGIQNRIKLLGYVPDETLAMLYRGAIALVCPSLWEGFCLPAAEAMATGAPVIASHTGSLPEIVGPAGIFIAVNDTAGLISALQRVTNQTQRKIFREKGLKQAQKYNWDHFTKEIYAVISRYNQK